MAEPKAPFNAPDHYLFSIEYPSDSAPIRGRSIIDLYRAFSINSMVAFVGSGTSVVLGYPTWHKFALELGKAVQAMAKEKGRPTDQRTARYYDKLQVAIEKYIGRLSADWSDPADRFDMLSLSSDMVELIEQLSRESSDATSASDQNNTDLEHANGSGPKKSDGLPDFYRQTFEMRKRRIAPRSATSGGDALQRKIRHIYAKYKAVFAGSETSPERSLPADFLAGEELLRLLLNGSSEPPRNKEPHEPDVLLDEQRTSLDVLTCLRSDWNISRFVTLNYDHEIERQLEDHTFPYFSLTPRPPDASGNHDRKSASVPTSGADHSDVARSRLGERALSVDLCPENVAELMLFAADLSPARVQVLHLHGSVRDPATMIVTDRDYNKRYYTNGGWPSVLSDGQELLFRGNAIVVVGVGMNEDELLRPLRILAQAPGRESRPVFALLPSSGEHTDTATAIKLYQRYGVRSIFFGTKLGTDEEFGYLGEHALFVDYKSKASPTENVREADLSTMQKEVDFLKLLRLSIKAKRALLNAELDVPGDDNARQLRNKRIERRRSDLDRHLDRLFKRLRVIAKDKNAPLLAENIRYKRLPRLLLTRWHSDVFALILLCIVDREIFDRIDRQQLDALDSAVASLESAIRTRALIDALGFIAKRAKAWRQRWTRYPGHDHHPRGNDNPAAPAFRRLPQRHELPALVRRHICAPIDLGRNSLFEQYVDNDSLSLATAHRILETRTPIACCLWSTGKGKGYAASLIARTPIRQDAATSHHRIVVAFSQSCEFDSCFDLIAELVLLVRENKNAYVECVLVQADLIFSKKKRTPQLAEWDAVLRMLVAQAVATKRIRIVVMCQYPETRDYFSLIGGPDNCTTIDSPKLLKAGKEPAPASPDAIAYIISRCKSRWAALFLTRLIEHVERSNPPTDNDGASDGDTRGDGERENAAASTGDDIKPRLEPESTPGTFRARLIDNVCDRLRQVQDPRERVATVIDVAMADFERHVIAHGNRRARLQKIVALAIVRDLFALGTPTRQELIRHFPQISEILSSYREQHEAGVIQSAVDLLVDLRLVIRLYRHTDDSTFRLGLHGCTRDYLRSKKSLPFARVEGREHTALTVLAVLAEEITPLEQEDFRFLEQLFENLVAASETYADAVLAAECIRGAFGLLRGSMRIGVVLRATPPTAQQSARSPLDNYFRRLLQIRLAALRLANGEAPKQQKYAWPLYEREWVWLFNEMGVVRLLQGDIHDATALLEQAINFEENRLLRNAGYEQLIYADRKQRRFSVSRLRIFMNLSAAALERGSFERVTRIVDRDLINMRRHLFNLVPAESGPVHRHSVSSLHASVAESTTPSTGCLPSKEEIKNVLCNPSVTSHRELEILVLVGELIGARVKYLAGSIGTAQRWLRRNQQTVVDLGVHGLTASFFKVYADVKQRKGESARAARFLSIARTEAEASSRTDAVLGVMLAAAEQARDTQSSNTLQLRHHLSRLRKIEAEAKRFGMAQVEATVCLVRARLYLGFGEYRSAREDIMTALTITTMNGMRVKRIAALIIMAALLATEDAENASRKEALQLLETARSEAERMGYKLAAVNATDLEIVLGRHGSIEDWASNRARVVADVPTAGSAAS